MGHILQIGYWTYLKDACSSAVKPFMHHPLEEAHTPSTLGSCYHIVGDLAHGQLQLGSVMQDDSSEYLLICLDQRQVYRSRRYTDTSESPVRRSSYRSGGTDNGTDKYICRST